MNAKKGLFFGVIFAFFVLGVVSLQRAMPDKKEQRIYSAIKVYIPYTLEKRMGGLTIVDSRDGRKEKPDAASVYHRLDELEKEWGKEHLSMEDETLLVLGDNNQTLVKVFVQTPQEREWIRSFFGI